MNIVVIGAGHTGAKLARRLTEAGHQVTATVVSERELPAIAGFAGRTLVLRGSDHDAVAAVLQQADAVVITVAGGYVLRDGQFVFDQDDYYDTYVGTARTVADVIRAGAPVRRVVFTSSTNAYGSAAGATVADEDTPATPFSPTQQAVVDAEQIFLGLQSHEVNACVLRVGHIYGDQSHTLLEQVERMPGRQVPYPEDSHVSTVHVDDVARACQFALEQGLTGIYNLVDDNRDSRAEFYGKWLRRRGMPEPRWAPKGGVPTLITNDKIKAAGFAFEHPDADLEDPLRQAAGG